jgi:hypothetical protein
MSFQTGQLTALKPPEQAVQRCNKKMDGHKRIYELVGVRTVSDGA